MNFLYNVIVHFSFWVLKLVAYFSPKIKLFVQGRKQVFSELEGGLRIGEKKPVVWIHVASLGEFEQGRPLIEEIKKKYPNYKIVLTFFSPSGYEVKKNYEYADVVCYLPMDTIGNAKNFVKKVNPKVAIFVKYEFWPNYLVALSKKQIPTFLISGIFRENQIFFKFYGGWMRRCLKTFCYHFVQDQKSKKLLNSIGINQVVVLGDTRFDRVEKLMQNNTKLPFINAFKKGHHLVVAGSTWQEDEIHLVDYINNTASANEKFVIVPHNIEQTAIKNLKESLEKKVVLYSELKEKSVEQYQVLIVDAIGLLSKIYAYADVAYVGGGYTKSGVHNTLEAATYGLPIVIGPNYRKFKEVADMVALKGCLSISSAKELKTVLQKLYINKEVKAQKAQINREYVEKNLGATTKIMDFISSFL